MSEKTTIETLQELADRSDQSGKMLAELEENIKQEETSDNKTYSKKVYENIHLQPGSCYNVNSFEDIYLLGMRQGGYFTVISVTDDVVTICVPHQLRMHLVAHEFMSDPDLNLFKISRDRFEMFIKKELIHIVDGTVLLSDLCVYDTNDNKISNCIFTQQNKKMNALKKSVDGS